MLGYRAQHEFWAHFPLPVGRSMRPSGSRGRQIGPLQSVALAMSQHGLPAQAQSVALAMSLPSQGKALAREPVT